MLPRRGLWARTRNRSFEARFDRSLVRNFLIVLLLLIFIPLLVFGTLSTFRTRDLLRKQITGQIENISHRGAGQLEQFANLRTNILDTLLTSNNFQDPLFSLTINAPASLQFSDASALVLASFRANPQLPIQDTFDQMLILSADGNVLLSTDDRWLETTFGKNPGQDKIIQDLVGENRSVFVARETEPGKTSLALYTARTIRDDQDALVATVIAFAPADSAVQILDDSRSFLPGSFNFYFINASQLISAAEQGHFSQADTPGFSAFLTPLIGQSPGQIPFSAHLEDGTPIIAFARWLPNYGIGILTAVSEKTVFEQSQIFDPFNIVLIGFSFFLAGIVIYFGSTWLVRPLLHLAEAANRFSQGHWTERARISRTDEIGLLAHAFNHMADELSQLYQTREDDAEQRVSQLEPASQTALPLSSIPDSSVQNARNQFVLETLQQRLAELQILASFNQSISAETDLNNLYHVLHGQVIQTFGHDLEFGVALYNRKEKMIEFPYYYENGEQISVPAFPLGDGLTSILLQSRKPMLLPDEQSIRMSSGILLGDPAKSWMGIPLIFAGEIIGAVILQDLKNENRFEQEDVNLLNTLAPQISTAVRNTQLYTEAQQALRAYDQERFLLNTLLDNMPEGITFKDTEGRYIRASKSAARIYHASAEELIGKTDYEILDQESAAFLSKEDQRVLISGSAEIGVIRPVVGNNRQEAWIHTSRIPITLPDGERYGLLIIQRDVTGLKQAEELAQRRAGQVTTAAEIARDATGTLDVKSLLQKAVNLIHERFGFYHASIFLLDPDDEYAVLRESTGSAGQQMLRAGHRLTIGSKSIVGQVSASGEALIVNDVTKNPTHFPNPLLPETQSELAIPLKIGERVLGVLDVQSTLIDAFNSEDINVLQVLADQLAVALVNGELFAKTQELLGKHRLLRQISIAASASTNMEDVLVNVVRGLLTARVGERIAVLMLNAEGTLQVQASAGYEGSRHLELRISLGHGVTGQAAAEKRPILVDDTQTDPRYINIDQGVRSELAIPILFNDELLGVLNLESMHAAAFDENDLEILGALGSNLGAVIANIRLINQVRTQVDRERQLFDVTSKIRRTVDLQTILETSTKELCRALGARRAKIQITAGAGLFGSEGSAAPDDQGGLSSSGNGNATGRSD